MFKISIKYANFKHEPPDSRGVSNEFVAMAAVSSNIDTEDCMQIVEDALNKSEE